MYYKKGGITMLLLDQLKDAVKNYLRTIKNMTEEEISNLPQTFLEDEKFYGLFSKGDDGIKRAKFLLKLFKDWGVKNYGDHLILNDVYQLVCSTDNPPKGLGRSTYLRDHIYDVLGQHLKITVEEIEKKWNTMGTGEGDIFSWEEARNALINQKMMREIFSHGPGPKPRGS